MAEASNRQKDLFLKALELSSPDERAAFLAQACGAEVTLRRQVEAMLHAHAASDSFLERPAAAMGPTIDEPSRPRPSPSASEEPTIIPRWRAGSENHWLGYHFFRAAANIASASLRVVSPRAEPRNMLASSSTRVDSSRCSMTVAVRLPLRSLRIVH